MKISIPPSLAPLVTENQSIWPLTSIRVGGVSHWLAKPATISDLSVIIAWTQRQSLPYVVLGGGTNVVFSDQGYDGVVIYTRELTGHHIHEDQVVASAGESLAGLAMKFNRLGLSGMEWACGIPGTVGGALVMNAGTHDGDMASVVEGARVMTPSGVQHWPVERLEFGYRTSGLRTGRKEAIALEVDFRLHHDDPARCIERERSILEARQKTQPQGASCGCIFKNPENGPPAGMLLDQAGCKGLRVGAATVSSVHANFVINEGQDNASDVLALIQQMKDRVIEARSISLNPEVVIVE
ncbi:UDP-N-acetylmuramate dehydrogenase [Candidatus Bipolaricaulota bacterium]|nr:UDP-N-acetylmuramate dehydrogenase [Candidatus Bipolaricaulota bacterium]